MSNEISREEVIAKVKEIHKAFLEFMETNPIFKGETDIDGLAVAVAFRATGMAMEMEMMESDHIKLFYDVLGAAMNGEYQAEVDDE